MKLSVRNLGRIREAEVDIRPLTVFVGQNDTNKTWLSYAFAALASRVTCLPSQVVELSDGTTEYPADLGKAILDVNAHVQSQFDRQLQFDPSSPQAVVRTTVDLGEFLRTIGQTVEITLRDYQLRDWLAVPQHLVRGAEVSLSLKTGTSWGEQYNSILIQHSELGPSRNGVQSNRSTYRFTRGSRSELVIECPAQHYRDLAANQVKTVLRRYATTAFDRQLTFPVDRVGLGRIRQFLKPSFFVTFPREVASPFPRPITQFLEWYNECLARSDTSQSPLLRILETRILGGEFLLDAGHGSIRFRPQGTDREFELQHASSLVNALAALALYLRTGSLPFDCLIIDEPELDAHPEAQLQILELLAMLANSGVHVVITTHSPYLLDHLHDLMEAARLTPKKQTEVAGRFKLGESRAFIDAENVAVYEFVKAGASVAVKSVLHRTDSLIDTATFSNPTNYLNALYPDLLQHAPAEHAE